MKHLYRVEVSYYVMAENHKAAKRVNPILSKCDIEVYRALGSIESCWYNTIPFGADDARTCGQIIKGER